MFLVQVDHIVYERKGGGGFGFGSAMSEVRGVGNAQVLTMDGQSVVERAGSVVAPQYVHGVGFVQPGGELSCQCGNHPFSDGFESCDAAGAPMEPADGWAAHWVCNRCSLVFDLSDNELGPVPAIGSAA